MSAVAERDERYAALLEAAAERTKVNSLTHGFYRYPARFGELFVRQAISSFSSPGDLIFDPFCGGGTTVVESVASGRQVLGSDLSPLALFVSRLKSTPLSDEQLMRVERWLAFVTAGVSRLLLSTDTARDYRLTGTPGIFRNLLGNLVDLLELLPAGETRNFARGIILRSAQWGLDGKEQIPTPTAFVQRLHLSFELMKRGMQQFAQCLSERGISKLGAKQAATFLQCAASEVSSESFKQTGCLAKLVVTSPPYLGVHVLYNKWQVGGRKETRLPFFIAGLHDQRTASGYTLVSRSAKSTGKYFEAIERSFRATANSLESHGHVVQLVSFANAESALPRYLEALSAAGLELCDVYVSQVGELRWRPVPSRRWYIRVGATNDSCAANEVLLIHRKRK